MFYRFKTFFAVVRCKYAENGLNSNKTELLTLIGNIISMIQIPCPPPKYQVPIRVPDIFLLRRARDLKATVPSEEREVAPNAGKNSPADCF